MEFLKTDGTLPDIETVVKRPCALLWDESFLWGVMTRRALTEAGVSFDPVRAADIREGALSRYRMLFVPGGWASGKIAALGAEGAEAIRSFVAAGGNYLGICGGAGMATESGPRASAGSKAPLFGAGPQLQRPYPPLVRRAMGCGKA